MAYNHFYRVGAHAVIFDNENRVLQVKATYGEKFWGLPGGGVDPGETVQQAVVRECREELGVDVNIIYMSGIYFHHNHNAHACVFRCEMPENSIIQLSEEHSEFRFFTLDELTPVQKQRVIDCMNFDGKVRSAVF